MPARTHVAALVAWVSLGLAAAACGESDDAPKGEFHLGTDEAAEHDTAYIAVVVADPEGDDLEPGGGEHMVIRNNAAIRIDMGGWWIEAAGGSRLPLGIGRQIDVGKELRVHTGSGEDGEEAVFAGLDEEALPNDGGKVVLRDSAGGEVMTFRYGD